MDISQLSLKRLFNRAGIRRVSSNSYDSLYNILKSFNYNILDKSSTLVQTRQNKVISGEEINNGFILTNILDIINQQIQNGGGMEEAGWCDNNPSQCGLTSIQNMEEINMQNGGTSYCDGNISQCGNFTEEAIAGCQFNQTGSGDYYFTIPRTQFQRFINEIINQNFKGIKITKSGLKELQYLVENKTIEHLIQLNTNNEQKVFQI